MSTINIFYLIYLQTKSHLYFYITFQGLVLVWGNLQRLKHIQQQIDPVQHEKIQPKQSRT